MATTVTAEMGRTSGFKNVQDYLQEANLENMKPEKKQRSELNSTLMSQPQRVSVF